MAAVILWPNIIGMQRMGACRSDHLQLAASAAAGWVGFLPRATVSTALPRAIILLPLRDAGKPNQRAGVDGGLSARFAAGRLWRAAPQKL